MPKASFINTDDMLEKIRAIKSEDEIKFLEKGDIILCEIHPKYGGYFTHVERSFSIGTSEMEYLNIDEGCLEAFEFGFRMFKDGGDITNAMHLVKEAINSKGFGICEACIHGHGFSSQEYPRYRLHATPHADDPALEAIGHKSKPGMVFAFNINLVDTCWRSGETGCVSLPKPL